MHLTARQETVLVTRLFRTFKPTPQLFPLLCLLVGILFSLYLQTQIPEGTFFSGDAGLKALLAQQLSSGQFRFDLIPPAQPWVQDLWQQGFQPYKQPFVYFINQHYYITFPYTFPLITAPFYGLFGYRGLYLVPLVATWSVWCSFYWVCRQLQLSVLGTSLGLATLIFASPLTLYSAMYWEHSLAVALAFHGFALLLVGTLKGLAKPQTCLSGSLMGLAFWFRPEFLALNILVFISVLITELPRLNPIGLLRSQLQQVKLLGSSLNRRLFLLSLVLTIGLFLVSNAVIYQHPLGIHAIQVVAQQSLLDRLYATIQNFGNLTIGRRSIFQFLPVSILLGVQILAYICWKRFQPKQNVVLIVLIALFFIVGVAVLVPVGAGGKQWGPRFLLFLAPLFSLAVAKLVQGSPTHPDRVFQRINLYLITAILVIGIHQNSLIGQRFLRANYQPVALMLQDLRREQNPVVVIAHQFLGQVFEPSLAPQTVFFRAEHLATLLRLSRRLSAQGIHQFSYLCYSSKCNRKLAALPSIPIPPPGPQLTLRPTLLTRTGRYSLYRMELLDSQESRTLRLVPASPSSL